VISAGKRSELRVLTTAGVSLQMQQAYAGLAHPHASRQAASRHHGRSPGYRQALVAV
jgi:hypothetical protein